MIIIHVGSSSSSIIIMSVFRYRTANLTQIPLDYNSIRCRGAFTEPRRHPRLLSARTVIIIMLVRYPLLLLFLLVKVVIVIIM